MSNRIFWAPTPDSVAHTNTSAEVVRNPFGYAWLGHNIEEVTPGCTKVIEAMERWGDSEDPAETGFALAFDLKGENLFQWFDNDGAGEARGLHGEVDKSDRTKGWRARRFGDAMKFWMSQGVASSKHVHGGFDWESLGKATVIDVSLKSGRDHFAGR
jgi:6-hydroxytryprostatin B O-methyltransferase